MRTFSFALSLVQRNNPPLPGHRTNRQPHFKSWLSIPCSKLSLLWLGRRLLCGHHGQCRKRYFALSQIWKSHINDYLLHCTVCVQNKKTRRWESQVSPQVVCKVLSEIYQFFAATNFFKPEDDVSAQHYFNDICSFPNYSLSKYASFWALRLNSMDRKHCHCAADHDKMIALTDDNTARLPNNEPTDRAEVAKLRLLSAF